MIEDLSNLKSELLNALSRDEELRNSLLSEGRLNEDYDPAMEALHIANGQMLEALLRTEQEFPSRESLGDEAFDAAWTILLHSISLPSLLRLALRLCQETNPGVSAFQLACLEDRIAYFENRRQTYGTQFDWDQNGALSPIPILDPETVDERRKKIGLGSLADAIEAIRARTRDEGGRPPLDWAEKKAKFEAWKKRVGWVP